MGFSSETIPYTINVGIDISAIKNDFDSTSLIDFITSLEDKKIDYIISNVSIGDQETRRNNLKEINNPFFLDDYMLFGHEWRTKFAAKIHQEDIENIKNNFDLIEQDLDYACHINAKHININFSKNIFLFSKIIKTFIYKNPDRQINVIIDLTEEGMNDWVLLHKSLDYNLSVGVITRILPDLPEEVKYYNIKILKYI
jgi:hypothetical protein